jgi:hypothetical protein
MCSSKQIKELAECNAIYEFEKAVNMYGKEYIRYYYNKLAELNGSINSTCNCQHNSNSRDNEPCCRCDSKHTNADRIRNMSDKELAEWIHNMCDFEKDEEPYKSIYNLDTEQEEEIHDSYGDLLKWLQSEVKVEESEEK